MADDDKHPPDNVVPLGRDLPYAVARDLREMYAALVDEKLPPHLLALAQQLDALTKQKPQPDE